MVKGIKKFKWRQGNSFRAWIHQIANNKICDYFCKNYKLKTIKLQEGGEETNKAISRLSRKDQQMIIFKKSYQKFFENIQKMKRGEKTDSSNLLFLLFPKPFQVKPSKIEINRERKYCLKAILEVRLEKTEESIREIGPEIVLRQVEKPLEK